MTTTTTRPRPAVARARWPLGRRTRLAVLTVHLLAACAWIGIDVVVAVLVVAGWFGDDPALRGAAYQALATFVVGPMLTAGLASLVTGLLLGLGTKWGLLRYWWVAVKLVLNVVLCTLIVLALQPGMSAVGAYGRALTDGQDPTGDVANLFFPPAVSLTALSLAVVLAVFKPWGRLRRTRPAAS
jgi:hypothetical protein